MAASFAMFSVSAAVTAILAGRTLALEDAWAASMDAAIARVAWRT